jgi:hypothetical protein
MTSLRRGRLSVAMVILRVFAYAVTHWCSYFEFLVFCGFYRLWGVCVRCGLHFRSQIPSSSTHLVLTRGSKRQLTWGYRRSTGAGAVCWKMRWVYEVSTSRTYQVQVPLAPLLVGPSIIGDDLSESSCSAVIVNCAPDTRIIKY